jgi:hypothetical protein
MCLQEQPYACDSLSGLADAPGTSLSHERGLQSRRYIGGKVDHEGTFRHTLKQAYESC